MKKVYKKRSFVIYRVRDGYIVCNEKKPFSEGHTHISNYNTAIRIMNISISKDVPNHLSDYLLESLLRLSDDEKFNVKVENMRKSRKKRKESIKNMKKLFISQPMRDKTDEEIKEERIKIMQEVCKKYDEPIEVIDSFFEAAPHDAKPLWFLGKSLQLLSGADCVYFADGWESYRGCKIEHDCAVRYGIDIVSD